MIWRVDRRDQQPRIKPEFYTTKAAAIARAKYLQLKGVERIAWFSSEATGPFVPEAGAVA